VAIGRELVNLSIFVLSFSLQKQDTTVMKKVLVPALFLATLVIFQFCSSSKKAQKAPKITYSNKVQSVIAGSCSPCHVGNARSGHLDSYDSAKAHINDIVRRIQLNPTDRGFMPSRRSKLPDSTIQFFVAWQNAGTPQ
jgi:hypothetical protein